MPYPGPKRRSIPLRTRSGNNVFIEVSLMKNEELKIRWIENFFQLFNYYKSREKEFDSVRAIKYLYSCQKSILQVLNTYFLNINFYPQFPNIFFSRLQNVR